MKNQESSGDFNGHHEAQKRKWPYSEANSYANNFPDKSIVAKKCMTTYNYDNFQANHQYIISTSPSNGQHEQHNEINEMNETTVNCNQTAAQMLNTMEISENIEYVNILYEDDLLTSIQAPVATESNYINFEPNWGNADILDLDQRNYYYEATNNASTVNLNHLNGGQMSHQTEQNNTTIQVQHHQSMATSNETQNLQLTEHRATTVTNHNNNIHNITEYEVIQNVYPEAESGREKSTSNLRKFIEQFTFSISICRFLLSHRL